MGHGLKTNTRNENTCVTLKNTHYQGSTDASSQTAIAPIVFTVAYSIFLNTESFSVFLYFLNVYFQEFSTALYGPSKTLLFTTFKCEGFARNSPIDNYQIQTSRHALQWVPKHWTPFS
jgi:hypothetical protein